MSYNILNENNFVIVGLQRGGTNVLWNIVQSHPQIVSPRFELGEIVKKSLGIRVAMKFQSPLSNSYLRRKFRLYAMLNLENEYDRYKYENILYTNDEMARCFICHKSVLSGNSLVSSLSRIYPRTKVIILLRSAQDYLASQYLRKIDMDRVVKNYNDFAVKVKRILAAGISVRVIDFDSVLSNPFGVSEAIFDYFELPFKLSKIRLKCKIPLVEGMHEIGAKYFLGRGEVDLFLNRNRGKDNFESAKIPDMALILNRMHDSFTFLNKLPSNPQYSL